MSEVVWVILPCLFLIIASCRTKPPKFADIPLANERLNPCPDKPNCVSSEKDGRSAGSPSYIEPLTFQGPPDVALERLKVTIRELGGTIHTEQETYLWATFTTRLLRFVDDVTFRVVAEEGVIHVRSGSRVGHSDFGVNRKRVERLRALFIQKNHSQP